MKREVEQFRGIYYVMFEARKGYKWKNRADWIALLSDEFIEHIERDEVTDRLIATECDRTGLSWKQVSTVINDYQGFLERLRRGDFG